MKLLIVTQTVDSNDPILGFFVGWIAEFAKHCEVVHVMALNVGTYDLPPNVFVHCLGKSEGLGKLIWLWRLWRNSIALRQQYDNVFVHMNPIHIVYTGILWRLLRKKIGLWYTHPKVDLKLRLAHILAHSIFTGSESSFQIVSKKKHVMGQGVDTDYFVPDKNKKNQDIVQLIVVGRLSAIKNVTLAIDVLDLLRKTHDTTLTIVGGPVSDSDYEYATYLKKYAQEKNLDQYIIWTGSLSPKEMRPILASADVFVHTSLTHSADKTLPEAMSAGLFVVTSNKAYQNDVSALSFMPSDAETYTSAIKTFLSLPLTSQKSLLQEARECVKKKHSLARLIEEIMRLY